MLFRVTLGFTVYVQSFHVVIMLPLLILPYDIAIFSISLLLTARSFLGLFSFLLIPRSLPFARWCCAGFGGDITLEHENTAL